METLKCKRCDGNLKIDNGKLVCSACGEEYFLESAENSAVKEDINTQNEVKTDNDLEVNNEPAIDNDSKVDNEPQIDNEPHVGNEPKSECTPNPSNKIDVTVSAFISNKNKIISLVKRYAPILLIVIILICLFNALSPKGKVERILEENHYSGVEVVKMENLPDNTPGLIGKQKLVLLKLKDNGISRYAIGAVNVQDRIVTDLTFGYAPLNIIILETFSSGKQVNVKNFKMVKKYITKYGYNCFLEQETCEEYIREITGKNGILDTTVARQAIIDSINYILPKVDTSAPYDVLFEDGNANPMYYAALSKENKYNWSHIFDEYVYNVWKSTTDSSTQQTMMAIYGPPYVLREVWAVVDKNLNPVGTYNSLEDVKKLLGSKKVSTTKKVTDQEKEKEEIKEKEKEEEKKKEQEKSIDEFNLLFIGRDNNHSADSIILFNIHESGISGKSIPRNTLINGNKVMDILKKTNGLKEVMSALESKYSVSIDYYAVVDLSAIKGIVDSLGGLKYTISTDMVYDDPYQDLHINLKKGTQVLNGEQVCHLLRFKSGYTRGDYARIEQQQKVLKELINQKLNENYISKIPSIVSAVSNSIQTNYPISNLKHDLTAWNAFQSGEYIFNTAHGYNKNQNCESVYILY